MTQKVLKVGSSTAVTIPKDSLRKLGWKPGHEVEAHVDLKKNSVTFFSERTSNLTDQKIARLTYHFVERYRKDLEALANE